MFLGVPAALAVEARVPAAAAAAAADPIPDDNIAPRAACLEAARQAERTYNLPQGLLVGIALNESGFHAHALNIGGRAYYPRTRAEAMRLIRNARGRSVMAGCVQVNVAVHARGQEWPLDPKRATEWAARYLLQHYATYGNWRMAVVRWHGGSPRQMTRLVCRVRTKMDVVAPNSALFGDICQGSGTEIARMRRNGRELLELAEAP